ncbi:MAG: hypothetical protein U0790_27770 [Isosphaeraceae bacterium]
MTDGQALPKPERGGGGEPPRTRLRRILRENPEARPQLSRAVGSLLGVVVATLAIVGILAMWHLHRRAELIRRRLGPPRDVSLPELEDRPPPRPAEPPARPGDPAP